MKSVLNICLYVLALFLMSTAANAAGPVSTNNIESVSFHQAGFFLNASDWPNPNSCTRDTAVVLLNTDSNYDKAYALLLSAYMSGKAVRGYSDGCAMHDG